MSYVPLVHFFFTATDFHLAYHWWPLAFLILSPLLQNFHVVLPTKKCLLRFFVSCYDLCRPFSRWASLAVYFLFCLSLALYSKFVDMTINLSLILLTTRIQKQFQRSVFVFIDSLVVSALQCKTRVAMRFPAKITSSCIWVAIPFDWVIYINKNFMAYTITCYWLAQ